MGQIDENQMVTFLATRGISNESVPSRGGRHGLPWSGQSRLFAWRRYIRRIEAVPPGVDVIGFPGQNVSVDLPNGVESEERVQPPSELRDRAAWLLKQKCTVRAKKNVIVVTCLFVRFESI